MSLGTLALNLQAHTGAFDRALKRSQANTTKFASAVKRSAGGAVGSLRTGLVSLGGVLDSTAAKLGLFGGGATLGGLAAFSIKAAADLESTKVSFETMLGSAEKADKVVGKLFDFSKRTPFRPEEVFGAARRLLASDFDSEGLEFQLTMLGDVAAGVGARIEDLAGIFGEVAAKGKADATDLRQFAIRGIGVKGALAKSLGVSGEEISKMVSEGKIGLAELQAAFRVMTSEGGKFAGGMERQSKTMNGLWSTLQGNIQAAAAEIGTAATNTGNLKNLLMNLNSFIESADWGAVGRSMTEGFKDALRMIDAIDAGVTSIRLGILGLQELWASDPFVRTFIKTGIAPGLNRPWENAPGGRVGNLARNNPALSSSVRSTAAGVASGRVERQQATQRLLEEIDRGQKEQTRVIDRNQKGGADKEGAKRSDIHTLNRTMQMAQNTLQRIEQKLGQNGVGIARPI